MQNLVGNVKEQAAMLAADNRQADPSIQRVLWFPSDEEIRLVEVTDEVPASPDGQLRPFYFRPSPKDGILAPSAMILIRPEEVGKLTLPTAWGGWSDAHEI